LSPIQSRGVSAFCADLVVDQENLETVYLLSVGGYQTAVKAIMANLLEGNGLTVEIDQRRHYLNRADLAYKVLLTRLPSGWAHSLVFPKSALAKVPDEEDRFRFFVFTTRAEEAKTLFFQHLDARTELPLHSDWTDWLWEGFLAQGWLVPLASLAGRLQGWSIQFSQQRLHDLIADGLEWSNPELIACFERRLS